MLRGEDDVKKNLIDARWAAMARGEISVLDVHDFAYSIEWLKDLCFQTFGNTLVIEDSTAFEFIAQFSEGALHEIQVVHEGHAHGICEYQLVLRKPKEAHQADEDFLIQDMFYCALFWNVAEDVVRGGQDVFDLIMEISSPFCICRH